MSGIRVRSKARRTWGVRRGWLATLRRAPCAAAVAVAIAVVASQARAEEWSIFPLGEKQEINRLSDQPAPFLGKGVVPERPNLLLELGDPFLDTGALFKGFELPGGAVWQPRLWVFATLRTALQTFDNGVADRSSEWASRLDLFANLQLTGTEKLVVGWRPLDKNFPGRFSRYTFEPRSQKGFKGEFNAAVRTLFFEGDLGSLLPDLDPKGQKLLDFGFSVGRQPLLFQEGILINDTVDSIGIVRNNIPFPGTSNLRVTALWGWNEVDRNGNSGPDDDAMIFALFNSADLPHNTITLDAVYTLDDQPNEDGFNIGAASIQRIGELNTTFRINSSFALQNETQQSGDGTLFTAELSFTPKSSDDIVYLNPFVAIGNYTQVSREPVVGGPLGSLGVLFASPSLGNFGAELNPFTNNVAGFATGYQAFWDNHRRSLVLEIAARKDLKNESFDALGTGFEFQQAIGRRLLIILEGFHVFQEDRERAFGGRLEFLYQF